MIDSAEAQKLVAAAVLAERKRAQMATSLIGGSIITMVSAATSFAAATSFSTVGKAFGWGGLMRGFCCAQPTLCT